MALKIIINAKSISYAVINGARYPTIWQYFILCYWTNTKKSKIILYNNRENILFSLLLVDQSYVMKSNEKENDSLNSWMVISYRLIAYNVYNA